MTKEREAELKSARNPYSTYTSYRVSGADLNDIVNKFIDIITEEEIRTDKREEELISEIEILKQKLSECEARKNKEIIRYKKR